jgi:hypothetical protein
MEQLDYNDMRSVTLLETMKVVIQHGPPEDGMVLIRHQFDGSTERVPESAVTRLRKYIRGCLVDVRYCGKFIEGEHSTWSAHPNRHKGLVWLCYCPIGHELSAWVRLEAQGYRTRFIYDPGSHLRGTLD